MIDGPRIHPTGRPAKSLVVFLHGYGADGNDLIDIGRIWAPLMPETAPLCRRTRLTLAPRRRWGASGFRSPGSIL